MDTCLVVFSIMSIVTGCVLRAFLWFYYSYRCSGLRRRKDEFENSAEEFEMRFSQATSTASLFVVSHSDLAPPDRGNPAKRQPLFAKRKKSRMYGKWNM